MTTSVEIEMVGQRVARLAELTAGFTAVPDQMQGAVLALLAAVRDAETRQDESVAALEEEKAVRDQRIEDLSAQTTCLNATIAGLGIENGALHAEREGLLQVNRALFEERKAFQAVEHAMAQFAERRRTIEAVLAAAPSAPDAWQDLVLEKEGGRGGVAAVAAFTDELGGAGAPVDADDEAGAAGTTGGIGTDDLEVVFRLPAALVDDIDRAVAAGRFASRDALAAAAIGAVITPDGGFEAIARAAAASMDPIWPRAGRRPIQG